MVTVYDAPSDKLIANVAQKLKDSGSVSPPEWAEFAKTGVHTEKAPIQVDWWYTRAASVLRKVYIKGPIGTSKLAAEYGGFNDRGSRPNRAVKGSRSIIRKSLMQLESAGLVVRNKNNGRVVTPKGQALLDNAAKEVVDSN
ncbi:MAG TPA: 30S ribosomal protein S19e [Methanomassiliicoccales archaeon]|nr:30S ribosomal protein S19e [Methanomassiliicoccales archaeon]HNX47619.1 30S ribosomal protein S19e [Methanomassiliicoccales archaeon]HPR97952.1 30S ribosomal protein S19e [Methanomassiliicoccales archaeon]